MQLLKYFKYTFNISFLSCNLERQITMERDLKDKVVIVTGGAQGIGFEIANKFLNNGAKVVVLLDMDEKKGSEAVTTLGSRYGDDKAVFMKCNVITDLEAVSNEIIETYKRVDVLVNNAGVANEESIRKTIEVNTIALMEWSIKFREHMRKDKGGNGGTIVNVGSVYSFMVDPYLVYYKASKFAVMGFTKSLGHEYNYNMTGVRVVVICPGFTYTKLTEEGEMAWREHVDYEAFKKSQKWQTADAVGKASVEIFERADSGTAWMILGGAPIEEVP